MNRLPDVIFVGPQRSGTTWLFEYFKRRGDVCLPLGPKELFYFDRRYDKGLEWYKKHFRRCDEGILTVDVSPTYFHNADACSRIRSDVGLTRIVCTLRNPMDRTYSLYLHLKRYGIISSEFDDALKEHPELLESSRYARHVKMWFDAFGRDRTLVLFNEMLATDPGGYIEKVCKFIGLENSLPHDGFNSRVNEASVARNSRLAAFGTSIADGLRRVELYWVIELAKKLGLKKWFYSGGGAVPALSASTYNRLLDDVFTDEINELESLLDVDLEEWRRKR